MHICPCVIWSMFGSPPQVSLSQFLDNQFEKAPSSSHTGVGSESKCTNTISLTCSVRQPIAAVPDKSTMQPLNRPTPHLQLDYFRHR